MAETTIPIKFDAKTPPTNINKPGDDGAAFYQGARTSIITASHADTAARGFLARFARAKGEWPCGPVVGKHAGPLEYNNNDYVSGDGSTFNISARMEDHIHESYSITGVTGAVDTGKYFFADDDNTATLTPSSAYRGIPMGVILQYESSTKCTVLEFGLRSMIFLMASGGLEDTLHLGSYDWTAIGDGTAIDTFLMDFHGEFVEFFTTTHIALTGASGSIVVNGTIGGTTISSAGITLSTAAYSALGEKTAATLKTDGSTEFHQGDEFNLTFSSASATRTTGAFNVFAKYRKLQAF